jgi:hypothetical protein
VKTSENLSHLIQFRHTFFLLEVHPRIAWPGSLKDMVASNDTDLTEKALTDDEQPGKANALLMTL